MKLKAIIAAIILSPFYITFVITGLLLTVIFLLTLRLFVFLGFVDGLSMLFDRTNRLIKRFNMRKVKVS